MALTPDPHANFLLAEMSDQLDFDFSNSATDLSGFSVRESGKPGVGLSHIDCLGNSPILP